MALEAEEEAKKVTAQSAQELKETDLEKPLDPITLQELKEAWFRSGHTSSSSRTLSRRVLA